MSAGPGTDAATGPRDPALAGAGGRVLAAALAAVAVATAVALFASQGNPIATLLPAILAAGAGVLLLVPMRVLGAGLLAAVLVVDAPGENPHSGVWTSPLYGLGDLLYENLHKHTGVDALRFSLADLLFVAVLVAAGVRALVRRRDAAPDPGVARCLAAAWVACGAAVVWFEVQGLARGGDLRNSLWQIRPMLQLVLASFAFAATFRTPRDLKLVGWIVILSACAKSLAAAWVGLVVARRLAVPPQFVATHSDSALFVTALILMTSVWYERRTRVTWALLALAVPLVVLGMVLNNRRLAYVEIVLALGTWWAMVPRSRLKVSLARGGLVAVPFLLLYVGAGWNSSSPVFRGARIVRSILDSSVDRSTGERDVENYNLAATLREFPLLGMGFGHEYVTFSRGDDISHLFPQWKFIPHNSVLGLWAFTGTVGFTLLWLPLVLAVWLAMRGHPRSREPWERAAAVTIVACVIAFAVQAYGDMGLNSMRCMVLAGAAMALAGRLAVEVGAWPSRGA